MSNTKPKQTSQQLVANFLHGLNNSEPKRLTEVIVFFKQQLIDLLDHQLFEDSIYREQWQEHLMYLESFNAVLGDNKASKIDKAFKEVIQLLCATPTLEPARKEGDNV